MTWVKGSWRESSARTTRLFVALLITTLVAGVDLWVKLAVMTPAWAIHHRTGLWFAGSCVLLALGAALALIPSKEVVLGAGIFCGGVLGNLVSASANDLAVPNPLLLGHSFGIAYNVADVSILGGNLVLMAALCALVIRNREQLRDRAAVRRAIIARIRPAR